MCSSSVGQNCITQPLVTSHLCVWCYQRLCNIILTRYIYRHEIKVIVKQILCINLFRQWDKFLNTVSHLCPSLHIFLFPLGFPTKTVFTFIFSSHVLHSLPISFFPIWLTERHVVSSTDHKAARWALPYFSVALPLLTHNISLGNLFLRSSANVLGSNEKPSFTPR